MPLLWLTTLRIIPIRIEKSTFGTCFPWKFRSQTSRSCCSLLDGPEEKLQFGKNTQTHYLQLEFQTASGHGGVFARIRLSTVGISALQTCAFYSLCFEESRWRRIGVFVNRFKFLSRRTFFDPRHRARASAHGGMDARLLKRIIYCRVERSREFSPSCRSFITLPFLKKKDDVGNMPWVVVK